MIEIQAQSRKQIGPRSSKKMKGTDEIPAVLYGHKIQSQSIKVKVRDVETALKAKQGRNTLINLKVEGDKDYLVLIKDVHGDVFSRRLMHVDFWNIKKDQAVEIDVGTRLEGRPIGLEKGGVLEHVTRQVRLTCEVGSIPDEIVVDVSGLDLNKTIHLSDLTLPTGTKVREGYNPTIASVKEEKEEIVEVVAAPAEGEAAAAGAAPAEGAAPGTAPGIAPGAAPGTAPGATPGAAPAAAPAKAPAKEEKKKK